MPCPRLPHRHEVCGKLAHDHSPYWGKNLSSHPCAPLATCHQSGQPSLPLPLFLGVPASPLLLFSLDTMPFPLPCLLVVRNANKATQCFPGGMSSYNTSSMKMRRPPPTNRKQGRCVLWLLQPRPAPAAGKEDWFRVTSQHVPRPAEHRSPLIHITHGDPRSMGHRPASS